MLVNPVIELVGISVAQQFAAHRPPLGTSVISHIYSPSRWMAQCPTASKFWLELGQAALPFDERGDIRHTPARSDIGKDERPVATHPPGVPVHDFEIGAHMRGEVNLVDYEKIASRDSRATLAGYFVSGRNVDDVNRQICQFRTEGGREVVATRFDQDQIELWESLPQICDAREVDRSVLP